MINQIIRKPRLGENILMKHDGILDVYPSMTLNLVLIMNHRVNIGSSPPLLAFWIRLMCSSMQCWAESIDKALLAKSEIYCVAMETSLAKWWATCLDCWTHGSKMILIDSHGVLCNIPVLTCDVRMYAASSARKSSNSTVLFAVDDTNINSRIHLTMVIDSRQTSGLFQRKTLCGPEVEVLNAAAPMYFWRAF